MPFLYHPPAYVQQEKAAKRPDIQQKSTGDNSPNVVTGNDSTVNINTAPSPQLLKWIAELGAKAAIVIRHGNVEDEPMVIAKSPQITGFWVHAGGYAATCGSVLDVKSPDTYPHIVAEVLIPPLPGDHVEVAGGMVNRAVNSARVPPGNPPHDLTVLHVADIDAMRGSASAYDSERGKTQSREDHLVPELASTLPSVGEQVFLVGVESGIVPRLSTFEGGIVSVGSSSLGGIRIFARFPFKTSYCGAPIFNSKRQVIGLVEKSSDSAGEIVVIPAMYILRLIKDIPSTN